MKTFKDFYEEKQADEVLEEGLFSIIGKILGIGSAGLLSAFITAMLFKGGVSVANSFKNTYANAKENFSTVFKKDRETPAVKKQVSELEAIKQKYSEDLKEVFENINNNNWKEAVVAFHNLPRDKQISYEIKKLLCVEIIKKTGQIPTSNPTPGNESYQRIKAFYDLATAKTLANAFQEQAKKYAIEG